jgi:hypothetical protein
MSKTFKQFVKEQSIRLGSGKKSPFGRRGRHKDAEARTPHIPHPITTRPKIEEGAKAVSSFIKRGLRRAVFGRVVGDLLGPQKRKYTRKTFPHLPEEVSPKRELQLKRLEGDIRHQQLYGKKHPYFGPKGNQQRRIIDKIKKRLKTEEAVAMNTGQTVAPGKQAFAGLPPDQPVVRKPQSMLRRKKPK